MLVLQLRLLIAVAELGGVLQCLVETPGLEHHGPIGRRRKGQLCPQVFDGRSAEAAQIVVHHDDGRRLISIEWRRNDEWRVEQHNRALAPLKGHGPAEPSQKGCAALARDDVPGLVEVVRGEASLFGRTRRQDGVLRSVQPNGTTMHLQPGHRTCLHGRQCCRPRREGRRRTQSGRDRTTRIASAEATTATQRAATRSAHHQPNSSSARSPRRATTPSTAPMPLNVPSPIKA